VTVNEVLTHSPAETEALGEVWGRAAEPGLVIALTGDLGAGKTALVRGLARGLGCAGRVHSPTFTLVNVYTGGRLPLYHLDLYRLDTPEQVRGAGLAEYLQPDGVAVIEWAERLLGERRKSGQPAPQRPGGIRCRFVTLEILGEHSRRICHEDACP
jgi:tRNA threonylcarbamoyladenosine biosynthesis protein TsaE